MIGRFTTVDPLATKYPWYAPYQFAGNEVPNAIDRDGLEPAYPKPDGTYTMARDGQLQKPLNDPDGAKYVNSKTQVGGADKLLDNIADGANTVGTTAQAAGYGGALFTDGGSLLLVPIGEAFDLIGSGASALNSLLKGNVKEALTTGASTVVFGTIGKRLEKLEKVGKIASHEKAILGAGLAIVGKSTDKGLEKLNNESDSETTKRDATATAPTPTNKDLKNAKTDDRGIQAFFH